MKHYLIAVVVLALPVLSVNAYAQNATCVRPDGSTFQCQTISTESENKFCEFMRNPSATGLRVRDRVKYLCEQEGFDLCSRPCYELHRDATLRASDETLKKGFRGLGQFFEKTKEFSEPYVNEFEQGRKDVRKD